MAVRVGAGTVVELRGVDTGVGLAVDDVVARGELDGLGVAVLDDVAVDVGDELGVALGRVVELGEGDALSAPGAAADVVEALGDGEATGDGVVVGAGVVDGAGVVEGAGLVVRSTGSDAGIRDGRSRLSEPARSATVSRTEPRRTRSSATSSEFCSSSRPIAMQRFRSQNVNVGSSSSCDCAAAGAGSPERLTTSAAITASRTAANTIIPRPIADLTPLIIETPFLAHRSNQQESSPITCKMNSCLCTNSKVAQERTFCVMHISDRNEALMTTCVCGFKAHDGTGLIESFARTKEALEEDVALVRYHEDGVGTSRSRWRAV